MNLPPKVNRKRVKMHFTLLSERTWEYLFDHEKENGLVFCRTKGFDAKAVWYDTECLKRWLVERNYYAPDDFASKQGVPSASPWDTLKAVSA